MATSSSLLSSMASEVVKFASPAFFFPPFVLLAGPPMTDPAAETFWFPRVASLLACDYLEPLAFLPVYYLLLVLLDFTGWL